MPTIHVSIVNRKGEVQRIAEELAAKRAVPDFYVLGNQHEIFDPFSVFTSPTVAPLLKHAREAGLQEDLYIYPASERLRHLCLTSQHRWDGIKYIVNAQGRADVSGGNHA